MIPSTVRSALDPTVGESPAEAARVSLRRRIGTEWRQAGRADLVQALRCHPLLLRDRSLLLNLAIEEYRAEGGPSGGLDLERHCRRFSEFGNSIARSIRRQLEAQRYLDDHPELLEALVAPDWPEVGTAFGSFHVLEELGFGAAARVYLCRDVQLGHRQVVVKMSPFSSFEASILGRLNHPNIIPIYSTGYVEEHGLHYLCTPYCGRSTLADLLDVAFQNGCPRDDRAIGEAAQRWTPGERRPAASGRQRWSWLVGRRSYVDGVLGLAVPLAEALHHAHQQQILHSDLKPSNVLVTPDGQPLLLDFNLSRDKESSPAACGGTLPYMPPEHLRMVADGSVTPPSSAFDPSSDIYSFGALLYELLTGQTPRPLPPMMNDSAAIARWLLEQWARCEPAVRRHNPQVSRRLEALVLRCLAYEPAHRPGAAELLRGLRAESRPVAALGRLARARPLLFAAVVGVPLAAIGGTAVHVAWQPPRHVALYERGLAAAAAGQPAQAADLLARAAAAQPQFVPARFQLARARVALGELDEAMSEFAKLARNDSDNRSMAYMGYCYNLKGLPTAAIPWHERAIENGADSAAVYNNLAASYLSAQTQRPRTERLQLAERNLLRALELDPQSLTVRLNIVRHAIEQARFVPEYDPFAVWQHADYLLRRSMSDPPARLSVALWYGAVLHHESTGHTLRMSAVESGSTEEASARGRFADLYRKTGPVYDDADARDVTHRAAGRDRTADPQRYFLEPVSLSGSAL